MIKNKVEKIKVYNEGKLVYEGSLEQFLKDNEDADEFIQDEMRKVYTQNIVKIECFHSGLWVIKIVERIIYENENEKLVQFHCDEHGAETTYTQRYQRLYGKTKDGNLISKWVAV